MLIFDKSPEANFTNRTANTQSDHKPDPGSEPRPNTLTCLEDRATFEQLRAFVYEDLKPSTQFQRCLADDIAEEFWMKRRFSDISNQSLSLEIENAYDRVSRDYPNADSALRTVLAWKEFDKDPSSRNALAQRTRSNRNYLSLANHLEAKGRRK